MNRIDKTIKDYNMIKKGDRIVVGLSGGADSICLTHYLKKKLSLNVIACHVNHNLRGKDSDNDESFVIGFCERNGIELYVCSKDVEGYAKKEKLSLEEAGREIRYQCFEEICQKTGATKIATAHTLSDNIETVLLNMSRGSGIRGLCGIPPVRGKIIRPLINIDREQVEKYCYENSLPFVNDKTNFENKYTRNKIRNIVLPALREINPNVNQAILRINELAGEDEEYFAPMVDKALKDAENESGYEVKLLRNLAPSVKKRALAKLLSENELNVNYDLVVRLVSMLNSDSGKVNVAKGRYVTIKDGFLKVEEDEKVLPYFESELAIGENLCKAGCYKAQIFNKNGPVLENVYRNLLYLSFDYDKIKDKLVIRQRKPGDKIKLAGSDSTKTLKKLFIEKKLSAYEKSSYAVVQDDEGVIGVVGIGVADRVKIDDSTKNVLRVEKIS